MNMAFNIFKLMKMFSMESAFSKVLDFFLSLEFQILQAL